MDFSVELHEFPSAVHRCIYSEARGLTPIERSLGGVADPEMRESCAQYHAFLVDMLSDMYENADEYALPVMALEKFLDGKKINGMKQKFPSKTKAILSQTRNAVGGYVILLYLLGNFGELQGGVLSVSAENAAAIKKRVNAPTSPIPLDVRLKALARVGLESDGYCFSSARYPKMFAAMCALAKKAAKTSGFDYFAFTNAEFRNIDIKYKPTYIDYFNPLTARQREHAEILHNYAIGNKLNCMINTFWKVDYKYKGTQVMCIGAEGDRERLLDIRVLGAYNWEDHALINNRLAGEPPEFQRHALRHIWGCDACSTSHLGRFVTILGKRRRVCGGGLIGFRWRNPDAADLEYIKRLIDFRCEIIEDIAAAEKNAVK